jgi:glycosyltransferase involved in cell wall biosynthesis
MQISSLADVVLLAKRHWGREAELAKEALYSRDVLPPVSVNAIKTIGMIYYCFGGGGAERVISHLIDLFASMGIKTVLLTENEPTTDDYRPKSDYVRAVFPAGSISSNYENRAAFINDVVSTYQIDLVINHINRSSYVFWDALVLRALSVPSLMHMHSSFAFVLENNNDIAWFLRQPGYFWPFEGIITLSRVDAHYFSAYHNKVFVLPNPISKQTSDNPAVRPLSVRAPKQNKLFELVWLSRLAPVNNYRDIVDVIFKAVSEYPSIHLTICANTPEDDADIQSFMQDVEHRHLRRVISFVGYQNDVEPYLQNADALLFLADIAGWPMTTMEAFAYALPVICYDLPWLELSRDGKGLAVARYRDSEDIANRILELAQDQVTYHKLSTEAMSVYLAYQGLDYAALWRQLFKALEVCCMDCDDSAIDMPGFYAKPYDFSLDPDVITTGKILLNTYNRYLSAGIDDICDT